jgi:hypothetical protein
MSSPVLLCAGGCADVVPVVLPALAADLYVGRYRSPILT